MARRPLIDRLLLLNLALQAFDLVATYFGLRLGWEEGNPLIAATFDHVGVGPALLLFKAKACACLFLLRCLGDQAVVLFALHLTAAVYAAFSVGPWLTNYLGLVLRLRV